MTAKSLLAAPQTAPSRAAIYSLQPFLLSGVLSLVPLSLTGPQISGLPALPQTPSPSDTSTGHKGLCSLLSYGDSEWLYSLPTLVSTCQVSVPLAGSPRAYRPDFKEL